MGGWAEKTLREMSLKEKVGQLICCMGGKRRISKLERMAREGKVGSIYTPPLNTPEEVAELTNRFQKISSVPVLFMDFFVKEGTTPIPSQMAMGATRSKKLVYRISQIQAEEARAMGIHSISQPVLDVNTNPDNPIINIRSFGENPDLVSELGRARIKGFQDHGVISCVKHFPGHGDTSLDSHLHMPVVSHAKDRLEKVEFKPFREAIKNGVKAVMTSHIHFPSIEPESLPATLSRRVITGLLREEMGFKGLIFTDGMAMKAVTENFSLEEAAVLSIKAGCDVILARGDYEEETFSALYKAVEKGEIPLNQVEDSARRVLEAKEWLGLHKEKFVDVKKVKEIVGREENLKVSQEISEKAVTLLVKRNIPLHIQPSQRILLIGFEEIVGEEVGAKVGIETGTKGLTERLEEEIKKRHPNLSTISLPLSPEEKERGKAIGLASLAEVVIFSSFIRIRAYREDYFMPYEQVELIKSIRSFPKPLIFLLFGSPYEVRKLPELEGCILTYDLTLPSISACVEVLFGERKARGRLPITISSHYPFGYGLD